MDFEHHPECHHAGELMELGTLGWHRCIKEISPTRAENGDLYATYEPLDRTIYYFEGREITREEAERRIAAARAA